MDDTINQAAALATMHHKQSMFLAECAANPAPAPNVSFEQEAELYAYFRKQGTSEK